MSDPGDAFWRRQAEQLQVIDAIRGLVDREPDRLTGVTTAGAHRVTVHIVDPAVRRDAPDLAARLGHYSGPRDGWPVPALEPERAVGKPAAEVAERYRREGFAVETHHLGDPLGLTADLRPDRIRLLVHDGRVVDAGQG